MMVPSRLWSTIATNDINDRVSHEVQSGASVLEMIDHSKEHARLVNIRVHIEQYVIVDVREVSVLQARIESKKNGGEVNW